LLYELVTGVSPYSDAGDENVSVRVIRDHPPRLPSARLFVSTVGSTPEAHELGHPAKGSFAWRARGDLDRITLHALEKSREHRYQTALALAEDLASLLASTLPGTCGLDASPSHAGLWESSFGSGSPSAWVRRVFTLLYSVVFTLEFAVAVAGVAVNFLVGRNAGRSSKQ
jgi:hypothetical protein